MTVTPKQVTLATLVAALERLRADVLRQHNQPGDRPLRAAMLKALDKLGRQLELDPTWFDDVLKEANRLVRIEDRAD